MLRKISILALMAALSGCAAQIPYVAPQAPIPMTEKEAASTVRACVTRWATKMGVTRDRHPYVEVTPEAMRIDFRYDYIGAEEDWHTFTDQVYYAGVFKKMDYKLQSAEALETLDEDEYHIVWLDEKAPIGFPELADAEGFMKALAVLGADRQ